jgi:small-conductance mechanosensitive channel
LNREIYKAFDQAGITIPFPQRDVYVHTQSA